MLTSSDRAIVIAKGKRIIVDDNVIGVNEHNTPLVVHMPGNGFNFSLDVHSAGAVVKTFEIAYREDENKFVIPDELDIKSTQSSTMKFDAVVSNKIKRK